MFIQESNVCPDSRVHEEARTNKILLFLSLPGEDGKSFLAILVRNDCCARIPEICTDRSDGVLWYLGGGQAYRFYHLYGPADGPQAAL